MKKKKFYLGNLSEFLTEKELEKVTGGYELREYSCHCKEKTYLYLTVFADSCYDAIDAANFEVCYLYTDEATCNGRGCY
jgi:hypothetical protein